MQFLPLYWLSVGYTDREAGLLGGALSLGGVTAGLVGGILGDKLALWSPDRGRVYSALLSVSLAVPCFWAIFFLVPATPDHFGYAAVALFIFALVGK